jgi:hypothetical protein
VLPGEPTMTEAMAGFDALLVEYIGAGIAGIKL